MTIPAYGYAALSENTELQPYTFERRNPKPDDVVIDILYCGICHTDVHHVKNQWGATFPFVPGHEIIGCVRSVGSSVKRFQQGDYVGVGCIMHACRQCTACQQSEEQYCEAGFTMTSKHIDPNDQMQAHGGYSNVIVVSEDFVIKVPDGMDLKTAAPLLCAGITVWSPLKRWQVGTKSHIAVVGLGGLGHMAVKLAKALGANVTVLSQTPEKENEALRLGADAFIISNDHKQMSAAHDFFELIIDTVPYEHDVNPYISLLKTHGKLVIVGYFGELLPIDSSPLILGEKIITGSLVGGIKETEALLRFCATHHVSADTECIAIQEVNEAFDRLLKNDVRYRFVIDMQTLS